jgi:hypothetical protein
MTTALLSLALAVAVYFGLTCITEWFEVRR